MTATGGDAAAADPMAAMLAAMGGGGAGGFGAAGGFGGMGMGAPAPNPAVMQQMLANPQMMEMVGVERRGGQCGAAWQLQPPCPLSTLSRPPLRRCPA